MNIVIPRVALGLWRLCDPESSRYYALGGVRFTCNPQGVTKAAACDGKHLGEFAWKQFGSFDPGEAIIPQYACKVAYRESKGFSEVALAGDVLCIDFESRMFKFSAVEGRFPRTDDVLSVKRKEKLESSTCRVDPVRFASLLRVVADLVRGSALTDYQGCHIDIGAEVTDTILIRSAFDGVAFQGALMPMHD